MTVSQEPVGLVTSCLGTRLLRILAWHPESGVKLLWKLIKLFMNQCGFLFFIHPVYRAFASDSLSSCYSCPSKMVAREERIDRNALIHWLYRSGYNLNKIYLMLIDCFNQSHMEWFAKWYKCDTFHVVNITQHHIFFWTSAILKRDRTVIAR